MAMPDCLLHHQTVLYSQHQKLQEETVCQKSFSKMVNCRRSCRSLIFLFFVVLLVVVKGNKNDDFEALRNAKIASSLVGGRCVGMICRDGALLLSSTKEDISNEKGITRQLCPNTNDRVHRIDESIAVAMSGLSVDCNLVCKFLKDSARSHRESFGVSISVSQLAEHISSELHALTHSGAYRPLAVSGLLAKIDDSYHQDDDSDNQGSDNQCVVSLVKFDCDGGYAYYRACSTETQDTEEDAVLLSQLQGVAWSDLTVDEARERIRQVLLSLHVSESDSDNGSDGTRRGVGVRAAGDQQVDGGEGKDKSQDKDKDKSQDKDQRKGKGEHKDHDPVIKNGPPHLSERGSGIGNRAHTITGWAAVTKQGLGGPAHISLSRNAVK